MVLPLARTTLRGIVAAALGFALAATTASAAHAAPSSREIEKRIDKASDKLEDIVESYNKLREQLKRTRAADIQLTASLKPTEAQLATARTQLGAIAASAYRSGQVATVNVVLDGPGDLVQRLSVLQTLSRGQQRQIDAFTTTTRTYEQQKAALRLTQDRQAAQLREIAGHRKKIEADLKKLYAMRRAAFGSATERGTRYTGRVPSIAGSAGRAVAYAYRALGAPYVFGAVGPYASGYDCSGLTMAAWATAGKSLPHNAAMQWNRVAHISRSELRPGDLVFYRNLGHVGLYVGNNEIIDAARAGTPVRKRSINIMTPYGYGRVT